MTVREVVKVPVARKPLPTAAARDAFGTFNRITLVASPKAPLFGTETMPPTMSMRLPEPPKVLAPLRTKAPAPVLVRLLAPEMTPLSSSPCTTFEFVAVETLKLLEAASAKVSVNLRP